MRLLIPVAHVGLHVHVLCSGVRRIDNGYVTGGIGVDDFAVPPVNNVVRGINGIAGTCTGVHVHICVA